MSRVAQSVPADTLRIDEDEDDDEHKHGYEEISLNPNPNPEQPDQQRKQQFEEQPQREEDEVEEDEDGNGEEDEDRSDNQERGVKEDLSEFRETLTRQLWGVASFLAPSPPSPSPRSASDLNRPEYSGHSDAGGVSDEETSDFVEASGDRNRFFEGHPAGMPSPLNGNLENSVDLSYELDDQVGDAVGITDEVLAFAGNIAHHPETWLDFPLSEDEEMDDFDMSDAQIEHVLAIEHLTPRLAALRFELCPAHMSDAYFWKVYFVLLHSRLDKHDDDLLSTPQSITARKMWIQELQKLSNPEPDWPVRNTSYSKERSYSWHDDFEPPSSDDGHSATVVETEKQPFVSSEVQIIDKSVTEEEPVSKAEDKDIVTVPSYKLPIMYYEEDDDDWVKENDSDLDGYSAVFEGNDEDVSFSDLEEDADCSKLLQSKIGSTKTS